MRNNIDNKEPLWSGWVKWLIYLSIGLIVFSFLAPILITQLKTFVEFNADTGVIGDTIGGIVNPFIALAGVIVTGLAFYMQLRANQIQIDNFQAELQNQKETFEKQLEIQQKENRLNQFEAQFYEMLRLHKENVNEIEITINEIETSRFTGYDNDNGAETHSENIDIKKRVVKGRDTFIYFSNELHIAYKIYLDDLNDDLQLFNFSIPYKAFFNGVETLSTSSYKVKLLMNKLKFEETVLKQSSRSPVFFEIKVKAMYSLFEGHENKLGHYYRHLFHIVKFVAQENEFLEYREKRKYLRILRAQLSNYEQAMLFYNSLAFAPEWEEENKFFSDYRMIHNLYKETLLDYDFFEKKYNELKDKQNVVKTYKDNDFIFEAQKWDM